MLAILPGFEERVMTVVTPADVARRAATILVDIPPVPRAEPALDTVRMSNVSCPYSHVFDERNEVPSACNAAISSTTSIASAPG